MRRSSSMNGIGVLPVAWIISGGAEVGLAVGEVARVDHVEAAAPVEQDALQRESVLGREVLHLGREVDAHAEVAARRVGQRQRDPPARVQLGEVLHARARPARCAASR